VGGLVFSVNRDFVRATPASAAVDMSAQRADVVRGCMNQGHAASVCECYGDEVLRRTAATPSASPPSSRR
jgi:hypothetical protein